MDYGTPNETIAANPTPPNETQSRIRAELEMHDQTRREMREKGAPTDTPEIDRELMMIEGSLQGLQQRVGLIVAVLQTVVPDHTIADIIESRPKPERNDSDFPLDTTMGRRLRSIQNRISEAETALAVLANGVRL